MKIAISISGNSLQSPLDPRFGRAETFCLVDDETGEWTVHENSAHSAAGGAGVQAAQFVAKLGARAVISGAFGPNAFDTLSPAAIDMYIVPAGETLTASDALALFKAGKLSKAMSASHQGHLGSHH
jgi:predicted Fe-Mo cluster-binding NifX family protein